MRLLTNPSSNLPSSAVARYDILVAPQQLIVDREAHDTRRTISLAQVDRWVASAREFPRAVGSSAQDMVPMFLDALEGDPELLVLNTSRRLSSSHTSAQAAAVTVKARSSHADVKIAVVDTLTSDLGAGLLALAAAEGIRAGVPMADLVTALESLAQHGHMAMRLQNLLHPLKSGRASFLKAWLATVLAVRPVIGLADGDLRILGRIREKDDAVLGLAGYLAERVPPGSKVWLGIAHGGDAEQAARCLAHFETVYDVQFSLMRPLSASIYLYAGAGALCVFVLPVADLPWPAPAPFAD